MGDLYFHTTQLFYQLSLAFFWPVAIALLALFAWSLLDLGALFVQLARQSAGGGLPRTSPRDLSALARRFASAVREKRTAGSELADGLGLSNGVRRFWMRLTSRLNEQQTTEHFDVWLEEALQQEEIEITSRLDRSRALIRIGPMLGLAGTIIPLGPALNSLMQGNMGEMVNHLVIGFGAVVVGLVMSGVCYFITLVRERWVRVELKEMENFCELTMRYADERKEAVEYVGVS